MEAIFSTEFPSSSMCQIEKKKKPCKTNKQNHQTTKIAGQPQA